jgi:sugar/nucleoside kinase (ribokinase family)
MSTFAPALHEEPSVCTFDVVCAGEALWSLDVAQASPQPLHFRPGGGAANVAVRLARAGLGVGLATALGDDVAGRALRARIAATGVDVGGVTLAPPAIGLFFVQGAGAEHPVITHAGQERAFAVPAGWQAQVLLLSGLSPVLAHAAALCKAARAARRAGSIVVVDVNARPHVWAGHDPRAVRSVLREADVVRCSGEDMVTLDLDPVAVRAAMRAGGVLVSDDFTGAAWATGSFGEVVAPRAAQGAALLGRSGDALIAAVCAELAREGPAALTRADPWQRALEVR